MLYFGSPACEKCIKFYSQLSKEMPLSKSNFQFVNGDDLDNKEVQDLCDLHKVDEYPHVKIYVGEELIYEKIGDLSINEIRNKMTSGN